MTFQSITKRLLRKSRGKQHDAWCCDVEGQMLGKMAALKKTEHDWRLVVGDKFEISTFWGWRIVGASSVVLTSEDDGQLFGLPEPLSSEAKANELLDGLKITSVEVAAVTGDLTVSFSRTIQFQILTLSGGYEIWHMWLDGEEFAAGGSGGFI